MTTVIQIKLADIEESNTMVASNLTLALQIKTDTKICQEV